MDFYSLSPTLQQATAEPRLCQRLLDTHGQVWVCFLWGHCSFLLGPGAQKVEAPGYSRASLGLFLVWSLLLSPGSWCPEVLLVPFKSLFPQSCVNSGGSMVGLMATSSNRAYAIPRSTAPRAPAPAAVHC